MKEKLSKAKKVYKPIFFVSEIVFSLSTKPLNSVLIFKKSNITRFNKEVALNIELEQ